MTLGPVLVPFASPTAAASQSRPESRPRIRPGLGIRQLRRLQDRLRAGRRALADCPWRATLRFVAAVAGVLALIAAAPEIAEAVDTAARWAVGDAAAAVERAVLAMAHAAGTAR